MSLRKFQLFVAMFVMIFSSYALGSWAVNRTDVLRPPSFDVFDINNYGAALFANPNREVVNQRFVNDFVSFSSLNQSSGFALAQSDGGGCRFLDSSAPGLPTFIVADEDTNLDTLFRRNVLPDDAKYLLLGFGGGDNNLEKFNVVPSVVTQNSQDQYCCEDVDYDQTLVRANDVIVYYSFGENFTEHVSKVCDLEIPNSNPGVYGRDGWHLKALSSTDFIDDIDDDLDLDFLWKLDPFTAESSLAFNYITFDGDSVKDFLNSQDFVAGLYWIYLSQKPVVDLSDPAVDPPEEPADSPEEPADPPEEPADPPEEPVDQPEEPADPPEEPVNDPQDPQNPPAEEPNELPRFVPRDPEVIKHAKFTGPVNFACSFDRSSAVAGVEIIIEGADTAILDEFDLVGLGQDVEVLFDFDSDGTFEVFPADGLQVTPGFYEVEYVFDYSGLANQFANVLTEVPQIAMGDFTTELINFNFIFNPCVFDALDVSLTSDKNFDGRSILSCRKVIHLL